MWEKGAELSVKNRGPWEALKVTVAGGLLSRLTCVVAALKERPSSEHKPKPAATDRATSSTPARPTAPWDLAQSHLSMVTQAYAS